MPLTATHISFKLLLCCTIVMLLGSYIPLKAQDNNFIAAEKLYQKGDYFSATTYYYSFLSGKKAGKNINLFTGYLSKNSSKKDTISGKSPNVKLLATYHLANSYRLLNDYANAAAWYDSSMSIKNWDAYPEIEYWQGVCMRATGNIDAGKKAFTHYLTLPANKCLFAKEAQKELNDLAFAAKELAIKKRQQSVVKKLAAPVNGSESNYAPFVVNQNLYFSSTRPDTSKNVNKINPFQHHIYTTNYITSADAKKVSFLQDANIEQGAATFNADGRVVFITQWEIIAGKKQGAIFISQKMDTIWSKPVKLDSLVNKLGYTSQQPFISTDGKYLFFSSNMPGGKGKFDIWCAELGNNYKINKVVNLGVAINTSANEKSPYFNTAKQTIIFASDGWVGMGGYDLFISKKQNSIFLNAVNLGSPINTVKDDEYFFTPEKGNDLLDDVLLSSDRDSKCCLELFKINRLPAPINRIMGSVKDAKTNMLLKNIAFNWQNGNNVSTITLDNDGAYKMIVPDTALYNVSISSANYADTSVLVSHIFSDANDSLFYQDFYLRPLPPVIPSINKEYIVYFDFDKALLNNDAKVIIDSLVKLLVAHQNWKLKVDGYTDGKGDDAYNLALSKMRTDSCLAYLKLLNINTERVVASFYGEAEPVAPNTMQNGQDNPDGRQLNRRVKLTLVLTQ